MKVVNISKWLLSVLSAMVIGASALANDDALSKANAAVSNVLFEYDGDQFASFSVNDDGYVDITFASNTPDALYSEVLDKLRGHADIKGVMAGKGGPTCARF